MRSNFWALLGFNAGFAVLEVVLFSRGLLNLAANPIAAVIAAAISVGVFIGVNYWLLNRKDQPISVQSTRFRDAQDYREALQSWRSSKNPFNNELNEATHQLDLFYQKQTALKALLGDQAKEPGNPFLSLSEDVQDCLFSNMKKIITRMTILDLEDQSRFPMHYEFLHKVLTQNKQLLNQYDNLIIEISQIGDSADMENLHLDNITAALHELRDGASASEVTQQLQQEMQE
ncbi:MAG: hypothetical protein II916_02115 [Oscillospiraceae bacterium]|nr:hypothetical protein [Oscillospiraceae bacterium]